MFPCPPLDMRSRCRSRKYKKILDLTVQEHSGCFLSRTFFGSYIYRVATQCSLSSLELRVQFCLLVCCTYPSSSTVNKEKNLKDQRASLPVDTRETQQKQWSTYLLIFHPPSQELSVFNQNNTGTVLRATLGRLLRDGAEHVWTFPSATMPSWAATQTQTELANGAQFNSPN